MKTIVANRNDFFPANACPIALRAIRGDVPIQHEGDLTDIRHTHDFSELILITNGGGEHWIDGVTYPVTAGDIFLIQGNTEHYFLERHDLNMYNIMFDDHYLKEHMRSLRSLSGFNAFFLFEPTYRRHHKFKSHLHIPPGEMLPLNNLLLQMANEMSEPQPGSDLIMLSKVLEIFVFISREYSQRRTAMTRPLFRLGEVISQLENQYRQNWTIARIAKIASMAPTTLIPVFKKVTGFSPIDYLMRVRLARAAEQLLQSGESISGIAADCGFADSNYFSRQFRKQYNCSPREYRKKNGA